MKPSIKTTVKLFLFGIMACLVFDNCSDSQATKKNAASDELKASVAVNPDPMMNKGIGPISEVILDEINNEWVEEGKKIYNEKCTSCHKPTEKFVGPAQQGVLQRRTPEWVMNMILNPQLSEDQLKKLWKAMPKPLNQLIN